MGRLEELSRQDPDSAAVHGLLGLALSQSADPKKVGPQEAQRLEQQAADELQVAVRLNPRLIEVWDELSRHFERSGDYERAAEAKFQQVRLNPDDSGICSTYAGLLDETGRPGVVLEALRAWVAEQPKNVHAYSALGMHEEKAGKDDEAIAAYRRAVELGESDAIPVYLGFLLGKQGSWKEAEAAFARGCGGFELDLALYGRAVALVKLGNVKEARRILRGLERDQPPQLGLIQRLRAVIQDPKIEPVLGFDALNEP